MSQSIEVNIRIRPSTKAGFEESQAQDVILVDRNKLVVNRLKNKGQAEFTFTNVYGPLSDQEQVYSGCDVVQNVLDGVNCCVMTYGQTNTGKTYTMYGNGWDDLHNHHHHHMNNGASSTRNSLNKSGSNFFPNNSTSGLPRGHEITDNESIISNNDSTDDLTINPEETTPIPPSQQQQANHQHKSQKNHQQHQQQQSSYQAGAYQELGIIPRSITQLFDTLNQQQSTKDNFAYSISLQIMQIYNEKIYDLLQDKKRQYPLAIKETGAKDNFGSNVYVRGLSVYRIDNKEDAFRLIKQAIRNKVTRSTEFNAISSRSHTVVQLFVSTEEEAEEEDGGMKIVRRSTLSLIDLAGSEKWRASLNTTTGNTITTTTATASSPAMPLTASMSGLPSASTEAAAMMSSAAATATATAAMVTTNLSQAEAEIQVKEMANINTSLHVLGNCIAALIETDRKHIPFRDSSLTRLLQSTLSGQGRSIIVATVHPDQEYLEETYSTLQFATRASKVKVTLSANIGINEKFSLQEAQKHIEILKKQIVQLKLTNHLQHPVVQLTPPSIDAASAGAATAAPTAVAASAVASASCMQCQSQQEMIQQLHHQLHDYREENDRLKESITYLQQQLAYIETSQKEHHHQPSYGSYQQQHDNCDGSNHQAAGTLVVDGGSLLESSLCSSIASSLDRLVDNGHDNTKVTNNSKKKKKKVSKNNLEAAVDVDNNNSSMGDFGSGGNSSNTSHLADDDNNSMQQTIKMTEQNTLYNTTTAYDDNYPSATSPTAAATAAAAHHHHLRAATQQQATSTSLSPTKATATSTITAAGSAIGSGLCRKHQLEDCVLCAIFGDIAPSSSSTHHPGNKDMSLAAIHHQVDQALQLSSSYLSQPTTTMTQQQVYYDPDDIGNSNSNGKKVKANKKTKTTKATTKTEYAYEQEEEGAGGSAGDSYCITHGVQDCLLCSLTGAPTTTTTAAPITSNHTKLQQKRSWQKDHDMMMGEDISKRSPLPNSSHNDIKQAPSSSSTLLLPLPMTMPIMMQEHQEFISTIDSPHSKSSFSTLAHHHHPSHSYNSLHHNNHVAPYSSNPTTAISSLGKSSLASSLYQHQPLGTGSHADQERKVAEEEDEDDSESVVQMRKRIEHNRQQLKSNNQSQSENIDTAVEQPQPMSNRSKRVQEIQAISQLRKEVHYQQQLDYQQQHQPPQQAMHLQSMFVTLQPSTVGGVEAGQPAATIGRVPHVSTKKKDANSNKQLAAGHEPTNSKIFPRSSSSPLPAYISSIQLATNSSIHPSHPHAQQQQLLPLPGGVAANHPSGGNISSKYQQHYQQMVLEGNGSGAAGLEKEHVQASLVKKMRDEMHQQHQQQHQPSAIDLLSAKGHDDLLEEGAADDQDDGEEEDDEDNNNNGDEDNKKAAGNKTMKKKKKLKKKKKKATDASSLLDVNPSLPSAIISTAMRPISTGGTGLKIINHKSVMMALKANGGVASATGKKK